MYSKDNYTILLLSMRIGRQGFPIYFECFEGVNNPIAFEDSTVIKAVNAVNNLFKNFDFDLIFLADRWFNSSSILSPIDSLGHRIRKQTSDLFAYQFHSVFYENVILYDNNPITTSIVRSKKIGGIETIFKNQKSNGFYQYCKC